MFYIMCTLSYLSFLWNILWYPALCIDSKQPFDFYVGVKYKCEIIKLLIDDYVIKSNHLLHVLL